MLTIKISFLSLLKDITGQEETTLSIEENSSIRDILKQLVIKFGEKFEKIIFNFTENLSKYIIISLNGEDIRSFENLNTFLHDRDEIILLPAIAGG